MRAKILIDNANEHIYRTIDEAKIKEAEYQYKLQELKMKESSKDGKQVFLFFFIMFCLIFICACLADATERGHKEMYLFALFGMVVMIILGYLMFKNK